VRITGKQKGMLTMNICLRRVGAVCGAGLLALLLPAVGATAGGATASPPQQRQIAATTLTSFKAVLTVTRVGTGLNATVTAAGYQNVAGHWKPIGQKRIGAAGAWFWYPTEVCGLMVTELKPGPSSASPSDTLTVSLLITPALGCSRTYSESWGASPTTPAATAYVVNTGSVSLSDTVTAINTVTNKAVKTITVGYGPNALAITPNGKTAYVVSGAQTCGTCSHQPPPANTVTPVNVVTNTALKAIKVGQYPDAIAITPNGKTAYVANSGSGTVTPINTATNTPLKAIKVGPSAGPIAITPNGKTAYVTSGEHTVTPINTATNTALKPITVGDGPSAIAITPNGKTAYVVNVFSSTVTPINTATNTALKAIKIGKPAVVGSTPTIVITPNGKTAYISDPSTAAQITPIATATNTALKPIKAGGYPGTMAITPNGRTLYVLTYSGVTPIQTATNTAGKVIPLKGALSHIAITPNGRTAYIVNDVFEPGNTPGTVIPLQIATGTPGRPIPVGIGPGAIAITP